MKKIIAFLLILIAFFSFKEKEDALTNMKINNHSLSPSFEKKIKEYNVFVNSKTEIITINITKEENEEVTGGGSISLKKGLNIIEIISYKENLKEKYILNIYRGEYKNNKSEANLTDLFIKGHEIDFKSDIYTYKITADDLEKELEISYKTINPLTKVKLTKDLLLDKEENIIKLEVTSEDKKNTNIYTIKVKKKLTKEEKEKKEGLFDNKSFSSFELKLIRIGLISLGALIIGILFYFVFIKKRTNKVPNILQRILHK